MIAIQVRCADCGQLCWIDWIACAKLQTLAEALEDFAVCCDACFRAHQIWLIRQGFERPAARPQI